MATEVSKDTETLPEVWLRGPVPGILPLLQPAAHALLQSEEELSRIMKGFPESLLSEKPAGRASAAFHLKHLRGVVDRMRTYALGPSLTSDQFAYLKSETVDENDSIADLLQGYSDAVAQILGQMKSETAENLTTTRTVGRKRLPTTVIGLYFHAAEHSQRHVGQLLVTVSVVEASHRDQNKKPFE